MMLVLNSLFFGLAQGAVLLMAALGLSIVFGLMGAINMAHGELMMLGAYATYVVRVGFKLLGAPLDDLYIFAALPVAFLVAAIAGFFLEKGVIRYLYGRPLETLLATWGVSLILQEFVRSVSWALSTGLALFCLLFFGGLWMLARKTDFDRVRKLATAILLPVSAGIAIATSVLLGNLLPQPFAKPWFGAQNVDVTAPSWMQGGLPVGSFQLPYTNVFVAVLAVLSTAGIYLFLQGTSWGLRVRAVTQNRSMSACLGIPTERIDALTFALGSGLAGLAGCGVSMLGSVGPNTGQNYIIDAFMVVVVGGVGKIAGSIVAAIAIGITSYTIGSGALVPLFEPLPFLGAIAEFFATTSMAKVMVFALIVAFLQVRPTGIFPQKGRTAES